MNFFSRPHQPCCLKASLIISTALLLCIVQPAGAALVSASASIDWSTFKITPIDIGQGLPTLTWISQADLSGAAQGGEFTDDFATSWSTGTTALFSSSTPTLTGSSSAATSASQLLVNSSLNGFSRIGTFFNGFARRNGEFSVQGNGMLLFQANYLLEGALMKDARERNTSPYVSSHVTFTLYSPESNDRSWVLRDRNLASSGTFSQSGVISVAMGFKDGWKGSFEANANTYVYNSPVPLPLPAGAWLFGSALAGIAGLRRSPLGQLKAS